MPLSILAANSEGKESIRTRITGDYLFNPYVFLQALIDLIVRREQRKSITFINNLITNFSSPKAVDTKNNSQSWLNISIDAALGCRANVFHILRHGGKKYERQGHNITIHPQAAPTVCR
jgi:hypothetical protein